MSATTSLSAGVGDIPNNNTTGVAWPDNFTTYYTWPYWSQPQGQVWYTPPTDTRLLMDAMVRIAELEARIKALEAKPIARRRARR